MKTNLEEPSTNAKPKQSLVGIELARQLAYEGDRLFTTDRAREIAPRVGLKDAYLGEALHHLRRNSWIVPVRRGLYSLSSTVPGIADAHEFEIAMALVDPAAISHWSAMNHHGLTDQLPRQVFVLTTNRASIPRNRAERHPRTAGVYVANGTRYRFVQTTNERFFGVRDMWVGEARVSVTDMERTLLDGLSMPRHCGGFGEVMHAFGVALEKIDVDRIVRYALRLGIATVKRLGWVLEHHGLSSPGLERLASLPASGYRPLDPSRARKGRCNNRWMVQENLSSLVR